MKTTAEHRKELKKWTDVYAFHSNEYGRISGIVLGLLDDFDELERERDEARAEVATLKTILSVRDRQIEQFLEHCQIPECEWCGEIICPWREPLHFHHDGCPACAMAANP